VDVDLPRLFEVLERHRVAYVLIGGLAAVYHGSPLPTEDADITPLADPANLTRLAAALRDLNARVRTESEGLPFACDAESLAEPSSGFMRTSFVRNGAGRFASYQYTPEPQEISTMALAAIVLYLTFGALGFGWRSWIHYRSTGSTGFRGIRGRPGSLEWLAGAGFVAAITVGAAAPVLQLLGALSPVEVLHTPLIQALGTIAAVGGIAATLYAQHDMGHSWRIGVDPSETTTLVRHGTFALVRNPIFRHAHLRRRHRPHDTQSTGPGRIPGAVRHDRIASPRRRRALPAAHPRRFLPRLPQ